VGHTDSNDKFEKEIDGGDGGMHKTKSHLHVSFLGLSNVATIYSRKAEERSYRDEAKDKVQFQKILTIISHQ
jgi:hypothetical protein